MNVIFYHENLDSVVNGWKAGLESCGISEFYSIARHVAKAPYIKSNIDLLILENPSENDLCFFDEYFNRSKLPTKFICIVGDEYKLFYKNHPFVNLWVEPCFYDKITEESFKKDNLPFYYCPLASQDSLIPFYTELNREFDLSTDNPLKEPWKIITIPKNTERPETIYGNTKVNLNYQIPRKDFVYLNQKAFDIPMSGNFELSTIPQVIDVFEGKVGYTSEPEMRNKIQYYIDHEEERTRMAIKAYEVVIAKHTYTYRMRDMLKVLKML